MLCSYIDFHLSHTISKYDECKKSATLETLKACLIRNKCALCLFLRYPSCWVCERALMYDLPATEASLWPQHQEVNCSPGSLSPKGSLVRGAGTTLPTPHKNPLIFTTA